ncbi:hypothetical protein D3C77_739030 [compost metagenome]
MFVALKVGNIHRIEAYQRGPQAQVSLSQAIARQITLLSQNLLQPCQGVEYPVYCFVIGFLAGGKAGLIHPVVHQVVNPAVQLINFPA